MRTLPASLPALLFVLLRSLLLLVFPRTVASSFQFIYLVGLEGVGHHGVYYFLTDLARSCDRHFVPEPEGHMGSFIETNLGTTEAGPDWDLFRYYINTNVPEKKRSVLRRTGTLVFSFSFPRMNFTRSPVSLDSVKADGRYDLEGIVLNISTVNRNKNKDIELKFLYLEREPYNTVTSHCSFERDGQTNKRLERTQRCITHAHYMSIYNEYLEKEYETTRQLVPGLWSRMYYEWFLDPSQCLTLVRSMASFLNWNTPDRPCDFVSACENIAQKTHPTTTSKHRVNCEDYQFIKRQQLTMPAIPLLVGTENLTRVFNATEMLERDLCGEIQQGSEQ